MSLSHRFAALALALGLLPAALPARFLVVDPGSPVYLELALLAGEEIKVKKDSVILGNLHSNDEVEISKDVLVEGDVSAVDEIENEGTITGSSTPDAAFRPLPALPSESEMRALADRVFTENVEWDDQRPATVPPIYQKNLDLEISIGLESVGLIDRLAEIGIERAFLDHDR